ncbi:MAG TPA: acyltransferase [Pseudomonadales bacterium]|nr:acyltransferase [Pseudomonadales bacterium]
MDVTSPLPALFAVLLALATCCVLLRRSAVVPDSNRFATIDGLRGYLAFFVFLHHTAIWYFYARTHTWAPPPSNLYENFGAASVALFFMITAFLFYSKIIHAREKSLNWTQLFISRIVRLMPLYLVVMLLMFFIVICLSAGEWRDPLVKLVKDSLRWLSFSTFGEPDLNGVAGTRFIIADVNWSLPYEWLFYMVLPIIALIHRVAAPPWFYLISLAAIGAAFIWKPHAIHLASFLSGLIAAQLYSNDSFRARARHPIASIIALSCWLVAVLFFPTTNAALPLALLSVSFILIAGGANLFGLLLLPASRLLGEMAYSIYLLHGITLFALFTFVLPDANRFTPTQHWLLILALTPLLVGLCHLSFRLIERPAMGQTPRLLRWLKPS